MNGRESFLKLKAKESYDVVKQAMGDRCEAMKKLDSLRNDMLRHESKRNRLVVDSRLLWLKNGGTKKDMYVREEKSMSGNLKTDLYLIDKFGPVEEETPVVYGDITLNNDGKVALCLPPK